MCANFTLHVAQEVRPTSKRRDFLLLFRIYLLSSSVKVVEDVRRQVFQVSEVTRKEKS
jgi:hypothetical protein